MNSNSPLQSRSLALFLFRPLEITAFAAFLLIIAKLTLKVASPLISWWMIVLAVVIVPVLFAILFAAIYAITWFFSYSEE